MKYMLWGDLEPGDILRFTDERLSICSYDFEKEYKNKDLIVNSIHFSRHYITIEFINNGSYSISYIGTGFHRKGIVVFKLVKLKDE